MVEPAIYFAVKVGAITEMGHNLLIMIDRASEILRHMIFDPKYIFIDIRTNLNLPQKSSF